MPSKIKPRLSRGLLEMKFMKSTKVKVDKEDGDEQSRALYSNEINAKMLNSNSNFIIEPSYTICAGLIDGRLSFRGMNPDLELLMEQELAQKLAKEKPEQPKEVSDQDMAKAYYTNKAPSAAKNMSKKFSTKNNLKRRQGHQKQQKPQFKRPRDEDDG